MRLTQRSVLPRSVAVLVALLLAVTGFAPAQAPPVAAPVRPNIIVVMTDDQTVEALRVMPSTRQLIGERGAAFTNSFTVYPLCCPSRATLLTGQYPHNHNVWWNRPPSGGYQAFDGTRALPVALRQAGYHTVHVGKYLNGYATVHRDPEMARAIPPGWAEWHADLHGGYFAPRVNHNGVIQHYGRDEYATDVLGGIAADVVRARAGQRQPFFLSLAFHAPHFAGKTTPSGFKLPQPAPRHDTAFAREPFPRSPSFNESAVGDKPRFIRALPPLSAGAVRDITVNYREELETLLAVDEAVQSLVQALRASGQAENTAILFTSDNGFFHGEHRILREKYEVYEEAARVPLLMSGPGVPVGVRSDALVANIDLAPTILDLADAPSLLTMDGRSLLPLVNDPATPWRDRLLLETGPNPETHWYQALRTQRYLYAEHNSGERELYDLVQDPHQLASRHDDPAYRQVGKRLAAELQPLKKCAGAACFG